MFQGFSPESIDFLWGIRFNNNRDWFEAHKSIYVERLYQPMKALGQEVFAEFRDIPGLVLKVSRIYRDARLHPDTLYKESLWLCIRQEVDSWSRHPALFFEIRPEGASYGFLLWQPRTAAMEAFRRDLEGRPQVFPRLLEQVQAAAGVMLTARSYRRPKPAPDPALLPYYGWKDNLEASVQVPAGPSLYGRELAGQVRSTLEALLPLHTYFAALTL